MRWFALGLCWMWSVIAAAPSAAAAHGAAEVPTATPVPAATVATAAAAAGAAAAAAATGASDSELARFKRAIRAKYDLKERAFAQHDAETIVTRFYTADVISVGGGEGIFVGRDKIRPLYEDVVRNNRVRIESVHTYVNGNAGWDWADFHVMPTDGKTAPFTFAILFLWARVDGEWMCKGDYFLTGSFKEGKLAPEASSAPAPSTPSAHPGGGAQN